MKILKLVALLIATLAVSACVQTKVTAPPTTYAAGIKSGCVAGPPSKVGSSAAIEVTIGTTTEVEIMNDTPFVAEVAIYTPTRKLGDPVPIVNICPNSRTLVGVTRYLGGVRHESITMSARMLDPRSWNPIGCNASAIIPLDRYSYHPNQGYQAHPFSIAGNLRPAHRGHC